MQVRRKEAWGLHRGDAMGMQIKRLSGRIWRGITEMTERAMEGSQESRRVLRVWV